MESNYNNSNNPFNSGFETQHSTSLQQQPQGHFAPSAYNITQPGGTPYDIPQQNSNPYGINQQHAPPQYNPGQINPTQPNVTQVPVAANPFGPEYATQYTAPLQPTPSYLQQQQHDASQHNSQDLGAKQLSSSEVYEFDPLFESERQKETQEQTRKQFILQRSQYLRSQHVITQEQHTQLNQLLFCGDKVVEDRFVDAMKDGNLHMLKDLLQSQNPGSQKTTTEFTSTTYSTSTTQHNTAQEEGSEGTLTDGSDENSNKGLYSELVHAQNMHDRLKCPHPRAGGFKGSIPNTMSMLDGKFVGTILYRVSSKKVFRKWKPLFFVLETTRIRLYDSAITYQQGGASVVELNFHPLMLICKPTLKKTYSLTDDGRQVFYCVFRENIPSQSGFEGASESRQHKFSPALESRRVCKFGSYSMEEVQALAHAIHGVVNMIQKRHKSKRQQQSSYPAQGRY